MWRRGISLLAMLALTGLIVSPAASASGLYRILYNGDTDFEVNNDGLTIDYDNTGTATLNLGNDGSDFEIAYDGTGNDVIMNAPDAFTLDAVGIVSLDSDASFSVGGAGISIVSDGGILAFTGDGTTDVDISNAGAALDFDAATADFTLTSTFNLDTVGTITFDSDAAVTVGGAGISLTSDGGVFDIIGDGTLDVNISNAGAAVDVDSATYTLDTTAASTITTGTTFDVNATGVVTVDSDAGVVVGGSTIGLTADGGDLTLTGNSTDDIILTASGDAGDVTVGTSGANSDITLTAVGANSSVDITSDEWSIIQSAGGVTDVDFSGVDEFRIREVNDVATNAACTTVGEIIMDTSNNTIYVCTVIGAAGAATWTAPTGLYDAMSFQAEYPNAVIEADGTTNQGKLVAEVDTTNNNNYYRWSTTKAAAQDIDIYIKHELPSDFASTGDLVINFRTNTASAVDNDIDVYVINADSAGTVVCASSLGNVGGVDTWASVTIAAATIDAGCTAGNALAAGTDIQIRLVLNATNTSSGADVGEINFDYSR